MFVFPLVLVEKYLVVIASTYKVDYAPDPLLLSGDELQGLTNFASSSEPMMLSAVSDIDFHAGQKYMEPNLASCLSRYIV